MPNSFGSQDAGGLLDVLPLASTGQDGDGALAFAFPHALASAWGEAVAAGAESDALLCAALAIAESRLRGVDAVDASIVDAQGIRQGTLEDLHAAKMASLLQQAGALRIAAAPVPVAWAVATTSGTIPWVGDAPHSLWAVSTTKDAPSLSATFRAPMGTEAVALLADATLRSLAGLLADRGGTAHSIDILDPDQRERQLHEWNDTARPRSLRDTVHGRFAAIRDRSPDALAVVDGNGSLTYAELDQRAVALAARLRAEGVAAGDVVAVAMARSAQAVVAILGTLKAGAAYLPLDTAQPEERLAFTLDDAHVRV
ncbi:MAG: AMP-binding protein, partial [Luteimonas sp.]|nr:AMP-binding protein [Luteimonas sp.]